MHLIRRMQCWRNHHRCSQTPTSGANLRATSQPGKAHGRLLLLLADSRAPVILAPHLAPCGSIQFCWKAGSVIASLASALEIRSSVRDLASHLTAGGIRQLLTAYLQHDTFRSSLPKQYLPAVFRPVE